MNVLPATGSDSIRRFAIGGRVATASGTHLSRVHPYTRTRAPHLSMRSPSPARRPSTTHVRLAVDTPVEYLGADGGRVPARLVHIDRSVEPASYTIRLPDGAERVTERGRLHVSAGRETVLGGTGAHDRERAAAATPWLGWGRLLTLIAMVGLLLASCPSEDSLQLFLASRRDSSTLGQLRSSAEGLWSTLTSGSAEEEVVSFKQFAGVLSVAEMGDGRRFGGLCGVWMELPAVDGLVDRSAVSAPQPHTHLRPST